VNVTAALELSMRKTVEHTSVFVQLRGDRTIT
jgi:hypothetical protein